MRRRKIEMFLICVIISCALAIIGVLSYVFFHKEQNNLPDNVFVMPYLDEDEIKIYYV